MADIKKSAQAAALEATGLAGKIDGLRQEFKERITRCEDRLREDIRDIREDMRGVRNEMQGVRDDVRVDIQGLREDMRGMRDEMTALRQEASNDRQQMLDMLSALMPREARLQVRDRGPALDP